MPVAADHKNQNAKLLPFVEDKVKVTGTLLEKGGLAGLTIRRLNRRNSEADLDCWDRMGQTTL